MMFGKSEPKPIQSSYLHIFARIGQLAKGGPNPIMIIGNKNWRDDVRAKLVKEPINKQIAGKKAQALLADIKQSQLDKEIVSRLSLLTGRCIQSEEEAENFLFGLAADSWAFNIKSEEIVEQYRKQPVLVWLRLLELIDG